MWETWVRSLGWEDPLEKGTAIHSSILAWRSSWTGQSMGSQSQTWLNDFHFHNMGATPERETVMGSKFCLLHPIYVYYSSLFANFFGITIRSDLRKKIYKAMPKEIKISLCYFRYSKSHSPNLRLQFSSVAQSCPTLWPHESQHARSLCPSPTPGVHSDSHPSSQWCHPAISSSVVPFSSGPQSLPASESFPMSQLFAWGGQSTGVSTLLSLKLPTTF